MNGTVSQPIQSISSHDLQIYGIVVTIILCIIVFGGVKMINRVAPAFLVPVLFSVFCIFIGVFLAKKDDPQRECLFIFFLPSLSLSLSLILPQRTTCRVDSISVNTIVAFCLVQAICHCSKSI